MLESQFTRRDNWFVENARDVPIAPQFLFALIYEVLQVLVSLVPQRLENMHLFLSLRIRHDLKTLSTLNKFFRHPNFDLELDNMIMYAPSVYFCSLGILLTNFRIKLLKALLTLQLCLALIAFPVRNFDGSKKLLLMAVCVELKDVFKAKCINLSPIQSNIVHQLDSLIPAGFAQPRPKFFYLPYQIVAHDWVLK